MANIDLPEFLDQFTTTELAEALIRANLAQAGTKAERIKRLCSETQKPPQALLELFNGEALRQVCVSLRIPPGRKNDMVTALTALLESDSHVGGFASGISQAGIDQFSRQYLPPSKEQAVAHLRQLTIPGRKLRTETDAEMAIGYHLGEIFEDVVSQYNIGGYLGLKIDIDVGNGKVGVEVKLAGSLLNSASEIHRLIGQAVYYQKKRYMGNLIVAVAGCREDLIYPSLKEMFSFLESFEIACVPIPST